MKILPIIYLSYMFISFYFLFLSILLYIKNRKEIFGNPELKKSYSISIIVPAYNEGKTIRDTIEHIFEIDYPNIIEVIIVNDGSTDNTKELVEELKKKYPKIVLINNKENLGNAAKTTNIGLKHAKGELIAVVDGDSYPARDSLKKMAGYFEDDKVGAVTCPVLARSSNNFMEGLQETEYRIIGFTRKLLGFIDAIYVTPGPLALYRKKALEEIGGFDNNNITQDIEIAWNLISKKWKIRMPLTTYVSSTVPEKFRAWYKQRLRWGIGGIQCISKYKKEFMKKGMLGMFVLPFFILQFFLGVLGLGVFAYLIITRAISNYLLAAYSIHAGVPLLTIDDLYITPNVLNYIGISLFILGMSFTLIVLSKLKGVVLKKQNLFQIIFYSAVYLMIYPIIAIHSLYKYFKRNYKWR